MDEPIFGTGWKSTIARLCVIALIGMFLDWGVALIMTGAYGVAHYMDEKSKRNG